MYGYKAFDLYYLKRLYGQPVTLTIVRSKTIDPSSGRVTKVEEPHLILRAIVAPPDFIRVQESASGRVADTDIDLVIVLDNKDCPEAVTPGQKYQDWTFTVNGRTMSVSSTNMLGAQQVMLFYCVYKEAKNV